MNIKQLLAAAKAAIAEGDLEKAEQLTAQAKALKAVESLEEPEAAPETAERTPDEVAEVEGLKAKVTELEAFKARVEAEPATKTSKTATVIEDEADKKAAKPFNTLGEQLKAVANAALYPHATDSRLKAQKAALGQQEGVSSDGGFLVQQDFVSEIFNIEHDAGALAQRVRRIPLGANSNGLKLNAVDESSRATGSRWGGIRGYWVSEAGSITASNMQFRQMELNLSKLAVAAYATDELLEDSTALGSVISQGAREELAFMLDDAILNGTGAGQPQGILTGDALISVAKESAQAASTVVYENVLKMWSRAHARSRLSPNMVWTINQDIEPQLNSMAASVGTGGMPVYLPPGGLSQSPYGTLMGKPVIPTEFNATLGSVGDIALIDFNQYLLIEKGGVKASSSMHVQFLTDQMVFKFIYRVDGMPTWNSALTPYKGSNTQSPYVAVAVRG